MLATEADILRAHQSGAYTLSQLCRLCEQRTLIARDGGHDPAELVKPIETGCERI
jgi:hypothetical protein